MSASPEGIFTVDLEEWYHSNYAGTRPRSGSALPSHVVEHTDILLEVFERNRLSATFFVLGTVAEEHPALLREITRRGHEIACHGHAHVMVSQLGPEGFRDDLRRAKGAIEQACGQTPRGFRAPSWSISPPSWPPDEQHIWPLEILAEEGFTYDASLFPFRTYLYGVDKAPTAPHRIRLPSSGSILELPAAVATLFGRRWPFGGGFYFRLMPLSVTRFLAQRYLRRERHPFMGYIHPREVSVNQPRPKLNARDHFIHNVHLKRNREKLERLLAGARFCTAESFLAQYGDELPVSGTCDEELWR